MRPYFFRLWHNGAQASRNIFSLPCGTLSAKLWKPGRLRSSAAKYCSTACQAQQSALRSLRENSRAHGGKEGVTWLPRLSMGMRWLRE